MHDWRHYQGIVFSKALSLPLFPFPFLLFFPLNLYSYAETSFLKLSIGWYHPASSFVHLASPIASGVLLAF